MACVRFNLAIVLSLLLFAEPALAVDQLSAPTPAFYDRPVLVIDPGMHTEEIWSAAVDAESRWAVTGSEDKTVRVWSLADGCCCRLFACRPAPGTLARGGTWR